mmetsp:Transcript_22611/g.57261  ORF Transcript_22611/g.57261 Transcript_22611/m.57261 type:complete len:759 (+) Transcript_22611:1301-3577(+)|eukprot:CAMPEP_0178986688 /NCGR_PEP_ID=MMETSP0795-20121207/2842_1 /TAXON_ID=88552 /ORGANISM="Amoebophrya sp., Strain Ameob2" /LENGTH=758 /DNA_ID=CAMNT_0020677775 /DNA_START=1281 /DNA_END=3557 /DNA_ORIENTATION=-
MSGIESGQEAGTSVGEQVSTTGHEFNGVGGGTTGSGQPAAASGGPPSVSLWTATWARESHGLFDYEARHPIKKNFHMPNPMSILRKGTEVSVSGQSASAPESEPLARLVLRNGNFCVDAARNVGDNRVKSGKLWRVVRDLETGYTLQENDSIKLGRFKLRVRQIVTGDPNASVNCPECANVNPPSLPPRPCNTSPENLVALENTTCRICLLEGSSIEDPLIRPCECKGTIEYVHLACLRHWVRGKLDLAESQSGTYFYKPMSCELCKTQYATHMQDLADEKNCFPLIELPKTQPPFIVLERDSNRPELKGVHVISLAEKKLLKLGRGHESDVRFADVSISRWHASVHYDGEKNAFVLTDHGSKFGTLVAMKTPVPLDLTQPLSLQAGRTVLHFSLNNNVAGGVPYGLQSFQQIVNCQDDQKTGEPGSNAEMGSGMQQLDSGASSGPGAPHFPSGGPGTVSQQFPMFSGGANYAGFNPLALLGGSQQQVGQQVGGPQGHPNQAQMIGLNMHQPGFFGPGGQGPQPPFFAQHYGPGNRNSATSSAGEHQSGMGNMQGPGSLIQGPPGGNYFGSSSGAAPGNDGSAGGPQLGGMMSMNMMQQQQMQQMQQMSLSAGGAHHPGQGMGSMGGPPGVPGGGAGPSSSMQQASANALAQQSENDTLLALRLSLLSTHNQGGQQSGNQMPASGSQGGGSHGQLQMSGGPPGGPQMQQQGGPAFPPGMQQFVGAGQGSQPQVFNQGGGGGDQNFGYGGPDGDAHMET